MFCRECWSGVRSLASATPSSLGLLSDVFLLPYPALWRYCSLGSERPGIKLLIL
ncbi:rCG30024 [Rattus norvegicus]|uniref:RCG30024 n=1 Tax=Rattus norvegicus TaxID=10116 RepID=A6IMN0_RAT|nr:rCG30024 [Rattus norvegicus]